MHGKEEKSVLRSDPKTGIKGLQAKSMNEAETSQQRAALQRVITYPEGVYGYAPGKRVRVRDGVHALE